jgi:hypothetical protein
MNIQKFSRCLAKLNLEKFKNEKLAERVLAMTPVQNLTPKGNH